MILHKKNYTVFRPTSEPLNSKKIDLLARASISLDWLRTQSNIFAGGDPGISLGSREVQTLVQKGLLNFFVANYFSLTPLPLVTEKAETTTCFSICESQSPLARKILLCEQRRTDHRRVPKDNHIFEYPWNLVWWQNTTRVSLKKNSAS